jgi:hypothetical protein
MKLTLNINTAKLNEENLILLGKITDRGIFPLKELPKAKYNKGEQIPDFLKSRVETELEN